jgi:HlyD family secretion protein
MSTLGRRIVLAAVAAVILIIAITLINRGCGGDDKKEYVFKESDRGEVVKTITSTGKLSLIDVRVVLSKIDGVIEKLYADFNDRVKKGQVLARLSSEEMETRVKKLEAAFESARLNLEAARREWKGKQRLFKENLISQQGLELAEIQYKKALSAYRQVQVDYQNARRMQQNLTVRSPISGIVVARNAEETQPVGKGKPLFEIVESFDRMELIVHVDEGDIGYIENGQKVTFTVSAFPGREFEGTIEQVRIKPVKVSGVVSYQSVVMCENPENMLKPGMTATATIFVGRRENTLRVPTQALNVNPDNEPYEPGKSFIWKKDFSLSGKIPARKVEVETGLVGDMYAEILSDLEEGEEILVKIRIKK